MVLVTEATKISVAHARTLLAGLLHHVENLRVAIAATVHLAIVVLLARHLSIDQAQDKGVHPQRAILAPAQSCATTPRHRLALDSLARTHLTHNHVQRPLHLGRAS